VRHIPCKLGTGSLGPKAHNTRLTPQAVGFMPLAWGVR
jgi:hypothetical protein